MPALVILAFAFLILIAITALILWTPGTRTQAKQVWRLFTILHDDATARLEEEQEHQATLKALHETREQVAAGTFQPVIPRPPSRPRRSSGSLLTVLVLTVAGILLLGAVLTLFIVNTRTIVYPPQTTQSSGPVLAATPPVTQASLPAVSEPEVQPTTASQPGAVTLGMNDFTSACKTQYGDESAVAKVTPTDTEPPAYWVKCFGHDVTNGDLSLDAYCLTVAPGTRSENPKRNDYTATNDGWLYWECVPA